MHDSINMQTTDNTGEITDFISIKSIYGLIKDVLWLLDIFIRVALPFMSDINESYFQNHYVSDTDNCNFLKPSIMLKKVLWKIKLNINSFLYWCNWVLCLCQQFVCEIRCFSALLLQWLGFSFSDLIVTHCTKFFVNGVT